MMKPAPPGPDEVALARGIDAPAAGAVPGIAPRPVRLIVEQLDALGSREIVSIGDIIDGFGRNSFLPMMLVPALMLVSPLSGIPLFSTFCGLWIMIVSAQRLAQRDHLWLPGFITRRWLRGVRLHKAAGYLRRVADWLDRNARPRLQVIVTAPLNGLAYLFCIMVGLAIPFLELIPFSSSILGMVVCLIVVGLLVRDGVYLIAALVLAGMAATIPFFLVTQVVT